MDSDKLLYNLNGNGPEDSQLEKIQRITEQYMDKSNDEIFFEIIKINKELEDTLSEEKYNQIFEQLAEVRPMLTDEQNRKLDMVLKVLKDDKEAK